MLNTEQAQDVEVLLGLWHPTFARIDHQKTHVDAANASQHVAQKANVSGHINERKHFTSTSRAVRKAEIYGEASAFFFFKTIGVGAGECFNKRCLAVVNMTCGGDECHGVSSLLQKCECVYNFFIVACIEGSKIEQRLAIFCARNDRNAMFPELTYMIASE